MTPRGRPTGRLRGLDRWPRDRLPRDRPPDLAAVGALSRLGVTGVTDATPVDRLGDLAPLAEAVTSGALPQRTVVTRRPELGRRRDPLAR